MILGFILIIISLIALIMDNKIWNECIPSFIGGIILIFGIVFIIIDSTTPTPSAIDVYRNNTELKVTYEICNGDTLSCDSIIIFKNNIYENI